MIINPLNTSYLIKKYTMEKAKITARTHRFRKQRTRQTVIPIPAYIITDNEKTWDEEMKMRGKTERFFKRSQMCKETVFVTLGWKY